jgi:lysophospholipid acyltransferase (LPLAT)-like uncharacterized protein
MLNKVPDCKKVFLVFIILFTWQQVIGQWYVNKKYIDEYLLGEKKVVITAWHRCAIYLLVKFGSIHPAVLLSSSKDGDLLANFAEKAGVITVRGSSTRGGKEGSDRLVEFLHEGGRVVATVADGPLGPPFRAKPGLVRISQRSGVHLMPITWSANRVWMFQKAWDKMIIPKPFSTIVISASEPYIIPKKAHGEIFNDYVIKMEKTLIALTRDADLLTGHNDPNMEQILKEEGL